MKPLSNHLHAFFIIASSSLLTLSSASAGQIWDGGGADNKWNTAGNWDADTLPDFSSEITFAGTTQRSNSNDLTADSVIGGISFTNNSGGTASAFTLSGNRITLGGNMTTTAATGAIFTDIVSIPILLDGTRTITTNANHSVSLNGIISETGGAQGLIKAGASALTIGGNNTYTGVTAINVGAIRLVSNNGFGSTVGNTTITASGTDTTGGRIQLIGTVNTPENISISGTTEAGNFTAAIDGATGTVSGNITLVSPSGNIRLGAFTAAGNISQTGTTRNLILAGTTVNNAINNNAATLVIINSVATLKGVSGTGIGITDIGQNGTLKLGVTNAINTTNDLSIGGFGAATDTNTLDLASFNQTVRGLTGTVGTRRVINSVESSTSTLTLGNSTTTSSTFTFSGGIRDNNGTGGTVALVKIGTGSQTLSGTNSTYSGGTTFSGGNLVAGSNAAFGTGDITFSGTAIGLTLNNGINIANNITIGTNTGLAGAGLIKVANAQSATLSGTITINNGTSVGGHFGGTAGASTGVLNITGAINSTVNVTHRSGTLVLSGGGSYAQFDTNQGTTSLGANNGLSTTATVSIGGSGNANLDLAGFNQTLIGITRASATNTATIGNSSTTNDSTLTTTGNSVFNGVIQNTLGTGNRTTALTVASGSLTLSASNTYTGATTIDGGTLTITGATQATTTISVGAEGKLGLSIASPVTAASAAVTLTGSVDVTGSPTLPSYTLLTASSISGTPVLATPVPGYQLVVEGGNTLKLNATSATNPYSTWAAINATSGNPNDDFDLDGVSNAIEFVLGGNKDSNDSNKLPTISTSGGNMTFSFIRKQDTVDAKVSVSIEVGTTLSAWPEVFTVAANTAGSTPGVTVTDNGNGTDTITLTIPQAPDVKKFARLKVVVTE